MSDTSLTGGEDESEKGSVDVWNTMYKLSKRGVYERKWLGDYNPDSQDSPLIKRMRVTSKSLKMFEQYSLSAYGTSEAGIESYLEDHDKGRYFSPGDFGFLYAYRLANPDSIKAAELFSLGEKTIQDMKDLGIENPAKALEKAAKAREWAFQLTKDRIGERWKQFFREVEPMLPQIGVKCGIH